MSSEWISFGTDLPEAEAARAPTEKLRQKPSSRDWPRIGSPSLAQEITVPVDSPFLRVSDMTTPSLGSDGAGNSSPHPHPAFPVSQDEGVPGRGPSRPEATAARGWACRAHSTGLVWAGAPLRGQ